MERQSIEGDRPVTENLKRPRVFLSSTGHVKPRVKLRRPLRKAKYYMSTDSELVPGGKGEKDPC